MSDNLQRERLLNLLDGLAKGAASSTEEIEAEMRACGEDPDEVKQRGVAFVRQLRGTSKLEAAREQRLEQERSTESLREEIKKRLRKTGDSVQEQLRGLMKQQGAELSFSFRKIESLDDEDTLDAISDAEILRLWEEMEND